MNDFPLSSSKKPLEEKRKRDLLIKKVRDEEITFDQLISLSDSEEFSVINGTSISTILGSLPGWDRESVRRALVSYGIQSNATLRGVKKNESYKDIVRNLCNSTSTQWQKRIAAPSGWPWFGNVIATLEKLDEGDLPREISQATRFLTEEEKSSAENPYDTFKKEGNIISTPTSEDDGLSDLLGFDSDDSIEEDSDESNIFGDDDELNSLFE